MRKELNTARNKVLPSIPLYPLEQFVSRAPAALPKVQMKPVLLGYVSKSQVGGTQDVVEGRKGGGRTAECDGARHVAANANRGGEIVHARSGSVLAIQRQGRGGGCLLQVRVELLYGRTGRLSRLYVTERRADK
jgi:hypothetical protein